MFRSWCGNRLCHHKHEFSREVWAMPASMQSSTHTHERWPCRAHIDKMAVAIKSGCGRHCKFTHCKMTHSIHNTIPWRSCLSKYYLSATTPRLTFERNILTCTRQLYSVNNKPRNLEKGGLAKRDTRSGESQGNADIRNETSYAQLLRGPQGNTQVKRWRFCTHLLGILSCKRTH